MRSAKVLFYLFCLFTLLSVLGIFLRFEYLYLVAKTAILPCILLFYFNKTKKINYFFLMVLINFYIIDFTLIYENSKLLFYLGILLNINHFFLLITTIQNTEKLKVDYLTLAFTVFMFLLGFSIHYIIYDLLSLNNINIALFVIYSSILLCLFNSLALYNYLMRNSYINFYFGFGCLSIGLTYATYYVYEYVFYLDFIKACSLIFQVIAYYLFIKFMLAKERLILKQKR